MNRREYSPDEIKSALDNAKELEQIATRLGGQTSSYVLTSGQRKESDGQSDTEDAEVVESPLEPISSE